MQESKQQYTGIVKVPENTKLFEIAIATVWVDEHGIVCALVKPVRRTIKNQKELLELFTRLTEGKGKVCWLIDMTHSMPLRAEIREYLAKEFPKYVKAHAVVSDEPLTRTIATTFIEFTKQGYPINQFTNEMEAKEWLKTYL